ncbi:hypothetical protein QZM64_32430, partial [Burkholderia cepacia]|uniref:hypothetical protein n=1 Tax=Burkholderia cepacia TaxID=292 RepID=UPI00264E9583
NLLLFSVQLRTGRSLKADRNMNCFINLTYFSVRLLILSLSDPKISSLSSSAHTYRLLIFKEQSTRNFAFLSSAAFSAAEKRDYEPCFAARQQLFTLHRCDCGVQLSSPAAAQDCSTPPASLPLPRCVSVSAKEA